MILFLNTLAYCLYYIGRIVPLSIVKIVVFYDFIYYILNYFNFINKKFILPYEKYPSTGLFIYNLGTKTIENKIL